MPYNTSCSFSSVAVIESLPPGELRTGRELFESTLAPSSVADQSLVTELYKPVDRPTFFGALNDIRTNATAHRSSPIIHIETHGNATGLELAGGDFIEWAELSPALTAVNEASRMNLLVIASMCHGWHMASVLRPTDRAPAFGFIGTEEAVTAGDLLDVMRAFYSTLLEPAHDLRLALDAANEGAPLPEWRFVMVGAELMYCRVFAEYVRTLANEESRAQRVSRLVAEAVRAQNLDLTQSMRLRHEFAEALDDHSRWFDHYRARFLMLDIFPENEHRFPLRYRDCGGDAA